MSLKIVNETVYVIYRNGVPYDGGGRKLVYTSRGAANGVIAKESKSEAEHRYHLTRSYLSDCDWWELDLASREILVGKLKEEFSIVEYGRKNT